MEDLTETQSVDSEESAPPVRELTRPQRRVLGVLVEKGFTTPEYYPLTLKAVTTGCNQKSNRDPVTSYSEDAVEETLDELRQMGLVVVVHTESGRTERFRHFMRRQYSFTEPQLAIVTELLLRGRQQLGELRSRASRMVPIDGLDELRQELQQLAADGYVQASGPLDRRGIEIDHGFFPDGERTSFAPSPSPVVSASPQRTDATADEDQSEAIAGLRVEIQKLKGQLAELAESVDDLKRNLGVPG